MSRTHLDGGIVSIITHQSTVVIANYTATYRERVLFDPTGGAFTVDAPSSTDIEGVPQTGDRFGVKNIGTSATAITVDAIAGTIEDPASPGMFAATVSVGGAGVSQEWEYDKAATRWLLA